MKPILILTKNLLAENGLQEDLQYLGYEVLCSKVILERLIRSSSNKDIDKEYRTIIFSETIANQEVRKILSLFSDRSKLFIRKITESQAQLSLQEKEEYIEMGIDMCVSVEESLDILRDQLACHEYNNMANKSDSVNKAQNIEDMVEIFNYKLPKNEKKFLYFLKSNQNKAVTREDLCNFVWEGEATPSRLAQSSSLVKRINNRAKEYGMQENIIKTVWGKGYQLRLE